MKTTVPVVVAAGLILMTGIPAQGRADESAELRIKLSIQHQPLADALGQWARQTGLQLISSAESTGAFEAPALNGTFTPQAALDALLSGTSLTSVWLNDRTVAIRPRAQKALLGVSPTTGATAWQLAQFTEPSKPSAEQAAAVDKTGTSAAAAGQDAADLDLPQILVTASRILNRDIKRSRDDIQPYVVFDRKIIEQAGATNVEDFLKQRLPMATTSAVPGQTASLQGSVSLIGLRGLGPDETLILIDGHRVAGYGISGSAQQPDLNGIPLAAVERIEVLPSSASAIYGGNATGGVVNVVLRRDYTGFETKLTYGNTFDNDASDQRVDLSAGFNLNGGKTTVLVAGSYAETGSLLVAERDLLKRGRARALANNPDAFNSFGVPPLGSTTNISSATQFDPITFLPTQPLLTLRDGTPLNSTFTHVPVGYGGSSTDGGAALVANAGHYNLDPANTAQAGGGGRQNLTNSPTTESLNLTLRHQFTESLSGFVDASASNNFGHHAVSLASSTFTITEFSPLNPFQQAVQVTTPAFGTDGEISSALRSRRVVGGVNLRLPHNWLLGVDYTWSRTRFSSSEPGSLALDPFTFSPLAQNDLESGAIDVFRDTNSNSPSFAPYLTPRTRNGPTETTLREAALQVGGSLFTVPGGPVTLTTRIETRKESIGDFTRTSAFFQDSVNEAFYPSRSQSDASIYLESRVPFVSAANRIAGVYSLELQLAGRYDDYKVVGANQSSTFSPAPIVRTTDRFSSTDPLFGVAYQPVADLTLRTSYGTGFLPPAVNELVADPPIVFLPFQLAGLVDPRRGNEPLDTITVIGGGNPNLKPEKSKTWSVGLLLQPRFLSGLRASVDWMQIKKTDVITPFFLSQENINGEEFTPGLIIRGAVAPGDPFGVGPITEYHSQRFNVARQDIEAYDLALDYTWQTRWGAISFASLATRLSGNESQTIPIAPVFDQVGFVGGLKWKGNATLSWEFRDWTASWTTRYFDSYKLGTPGFTNPLALLNQGSTTIPSQLYHDLFASYRFSAGASPSRSRQLLSGLEVQAGVRNVFNERPPIDVQDLFGNLYSNWGDPRLATYYISVRKSF